MKMVLRLSEMGLIQAELGILKARSSVTNCIISGENRNYHIMLGTLEENYDYIGFITRVAGLSPIVALATAVCRKLFVNHE